ncbi:MAG: hypothetical protein AAGK33_11955 [Pseudomonadota bacterium]
MNRRRFLQSVATLVALPAMPQMSWRASAFAAPTATVVPAQARSWAIYISTLHGECSPQTLQTLLQIPASDAKRYLTQLVAEGVIKAHPLVQQSIARMAHGDQGGVLDNIKRRLEMKRQAWSHQVEPIVEDERTADEATPREFETKQLHEDGDAHATCGNEKEPAAGALPEAICSQSERYPDRV